MSRTLHLLNVLTGSVGTEGGTSPNSWSKYKPDLFDVPPDPDGWNELHFPPEYTMSHYEMSHILPHLVKDGRGRWTFTSPEYSTRFGHIQTVSPGSRCCKTRILLDATLL